MFVYFHFLRPKYARHDSIVPISNLFRNIFYSRYANQILQVCMRPIDVRRKNVNERRKGRSKKNTKQLTNSMDCRALHIKKAKVEKWVEKRNKAPLSYNCLIYLYTKRLATLLWIPSLRIHLYIFSARFNAKGFHFVAVDGWLSTVGAGRRLSCVRVYRTAWWVHVLLVFALNGRRSNVIGAALLSAEDCDLREITKGISKHIIACLREFQRRIFFRSPNATKSLPADWELMFCSRSKRCCCAKVY